MIFAEKPETLEEVVLVETQESHGLYDIDHLNQFYLHLTSAKSAAHTIEVE